MNYKVKVVKSWENVNCKVVLETSEELSTLSDTRRVAKRRKILHFWVKGTFIEIKILPVNLKGMLARIMFV